MVEKQKLDVDVPRAISDFAALIKEFQLKEKLYRLIFRGKALEFESYRNYNPDDDAQNIDWKASGRANELLVKQYREERDLDIFFAVDVSDNMVFGSTDKIKCEYIAEMVAALMHLILEGNDKIGMILYSDKIVKFIEPRRGINHFSKMIDWLTDPNNYGGPSTLGPVLKELMYYPRSMDSVVFVSDFAKLNKNYTKNLIALSDRCEVVALMVKDPLDLQLPKVSGEINIEDPVTGQQLVVNPLVASDSYAQLMEQREKVVKSIFRVSNVDFARFITSKDFPLPLAHFLSERVKKRGSLI